MPDKEARDPLEHPLFEQQAALSQLCRWTARAGRALAEACETAAALYPLMSFSRLQAGLMPALDPAERKQKQYLSEILQDRVYTLVLTSHHALVIAPLRLQQTGVKGRPPKPATRREVELLRNQFEHWDSGRRLVDSGEPTPPWADVPKSSRSGTAARELHRSYESAAPDSYVFGSDGLSEVGGVLDIALLTQDLRIMGRYANAASRRLNNGRS